MWRILNNFYYEMQNGYSYFAIFCNYYAYYYLQFAKCTLVLTDIITDHLRVERLFGHRNHGSFFERTKSSCFALAEN